MPRSPQRGRHKVFSLLRAATKSERAESDLLQFLDEHPHLIDVKDDQLRTPLHLALSLRVSLRVITALMEAVPGTAVVANDRKRLPIHLAAQFGTIEVVEALHHSYEEGLQQGDESQMLPLHLAAASGPEAQLEVIDKLLELSPIALMSKDSMKRTPLHWACANSAAHEVLEQLLRFEGVQPKMKEKGAEEGQEDGKEEDKEGNEEKNEEEGEENEDNKEEEVGEAEQVEEEEEAEEEEYVQGQDAAGLADVNGRTPLHLALGKGCSIETVKLLMEMAPDAVQVKDDASMAPLHVAVNAQAHDDVIDLLLEAYPNAGRWGIPARYQAQVDLIFRKLANAPPEEEGEAGGYGGEDEVV